MGKKQKIVRPPQLPEEIPDDEIDVSDEDVQFVKANKDYARFASNLDTQTINRHVSRVADVKEDELEQKHAEKLRKKSKDKEEEEGKGLEVDRVDALPVKTLDGTLYYRTVPKVSQRTVNGDQDNNEDEANGENEGLMKPTKVEKKAKLKKLRKEAKKQSKEAPKEEEVQQTPQAAVLAEVEKELTAEEANEARKFKLAELGTELLSDPESNVKFLKEMMQISKEGDRTIQILGLKSLLAVFKDIIPSYRIRLPTEKEMEMNVSKVVKKMRFYESTLLTVYKAYVQRLIALEQKAPFQRVAIRCICTLLDAVPHFNFRENLLNAVIKNISSPDEVVRKLCCATIKSLFTNEGKHGGEATVAAVQLIAEHVKVYNCQMHPDSVEVFMSLTFDEDIGRMNMSRVDNKFKSKKGKFKKDKEDNKLPESDRKKSKKESMSKTREEVDADFKAASFAQDVMDRKKKQSEILSAVFQTYFRILKHTMLSITIKSEVTTGESMAHPLLSPCLNGIGKFAHLIDMDFMFDLISYLRKLAGGMSGSSEGVSKVLTVSERLRCCIVTFKVMKNNLDALNVDLRDFFVQLYTIILEYRPGRDDGEVLAEALKIMLCDDRQHDMQRAAAFIKRLASFALCFGSAESMAALVTVKHLLQKNVKCRNLLENDVGGGSVSGQIAKYQPYASDPNLSGALASVLWELNILTKHYHPAVSKIASSISTMTSTQDSQVYHSVMTPQQAFKESSLENEQFKLKFDFGKLNPKRKRGDSKADKFFVDAENTSLVDEEVVTKRLCEHFNVIRDINETTRLKREMDHTTLQLQLYEQFKKQKKSKRNGQDTKPKKKRKS